MPNQPSRVTDRSLAWVLLALVFLAPLPFGSVEFWATGALEVTVFLLFIITLFQAWRSGKSIRLPLAGVALIYIALHLVQLVPLPGQAVNLVSPTSHTLFQLLRPAETANLMETISISPEATLSSLIWFCCCFCMFALPVILIRPGGTDEEPGGSYLLGLPAGNRAEWAGLALAFTLAVAATFQAAYGLLEHLLGWNRIFLYVRRFPMGWVAGTFINTNHCAAWLAICLPLMLALILLTWRLTHEDESETRQAPPHKLLLPLLIGATALAALALVLTHSSGGCLASAASLAFFFLVHRLYRGKGLSLNLVLFLAAVPVAYFLIIILLVSPNFTFSEFAADLGWDLENRFSIYRQSLTIAGDFPLFGSGAGTFPLMMLHYFNRPVGHAHNEYIEVLCDLGPLGLLCVLLLLVFLTRRALACLRSEHEPGGATRFSTHLILPLGMVSSLLALTLHAMVDFPLRIPAIALAAACIAGVLTGLGSAWSNKD